MNRRVFMAVAAAGAANFADAQNVPDAIKKLRPMLDGVQPITDAETRARIDKAQRLMRENKIDAIVLEGGSSMFYFTGVHGTQGQHFSAVVIPAKGRRGWVAPPLHDVDDPGSELHTTLNDGFAFKLLARYLKDCGATRVGIEERVRFAVYDGIRKEAPSLEFVSADAVTAGCRIIKSPAEIALMQRANDITIEAYRAAFTTLREGMTNGELAKNISAAFRALGANGGAMAIFGKYTAFPHGSIAPQQLREGDFVLIDDGVSVEGYQSDITRTVIFGKPTDRQKYVWDLERKAQDAALAAAQVGATCESVDAAARNVITKGGFGPGYKTPGLPHRTGHGIGLDGHEWTNLVKGNKTKIQPGMCFSDEPTIAIYGEFGVRLEDCMYITESGAKMFTKQSPAIDQPFG
ncbi:MAG TPA: Xaa-Pro peptidase family protein [Bryobacteraceae bacterium]|jgi:Xaa-Pro dipeptidase|nr:Xaa-Pro peptidase family protein [Bryobacteraceae bacterium]